MIDRSARNQFAELLRRLAIGKISNDEFEANLPLKSKDKAVNRIFWNGAWLLYDDNKEYKLTGDYRLSEETKHQVARWILFLKSDTEYAYPWGLRILGYLYPLIVIFSFGMAIPILRRIAKTQADPEIWPFLNQYEYQSALANPPYLNQQSNSSFKRDWPKPASSFRR